MADLIDALALFKASICQHNHLQARMHACMQFGFVAVQGILQLLVMVETGAA